MRLQTRFMISLGLVGLTALLVFAYVIRFELRNLLDTEIESQLNNHQAVSRSVVEQTVESVVTDLDLVANNAITRLYFSAPDLTRYQLFHSEMTRTLQRYLTSRNLYSELAIVLPDGFKEVYVSDSETPFSDTDNTLLQLQENDAISSDTVTFTLESRQQQIFFSVYYPARQYSALVSSDNNPIVAFIKVSLPLKKLQRLLSTENISARFIPAENAEFLFDPAGTILDETSINEAVIQQVTPVSDQLLLSSTINPEQFTSNTEILFRVSLVLMLFSMISLTFMTFGLLHLVILKPLKQFTNLVDQSDITDVTRQALVAYEQNEFGRLKQRFDHLMSRLTSHSTDLQRQAFTDTLTGLPNRASLNRLLSDHTQSSKKSLSVLFLDLDGFKKINDIYGHDTGDLLLKNVADRLSNIVRGDPSQVQDTIDIRQDAVFRLGGDEFTIVLMADSNSELIAQRIIDAFQHGVQIEGKLLYTGTSIGISEFPQDSTDSMLLIQYADIAMYRAKKTGKMRYCRFEPSMADEEKERVKMENIVREGIEFDRFDAYFQPKIQSDTGDMIGFEALARLRNAEGEMISPATFIPVAHEKGVLDYITYLVCEQSCKLLQVLDDSSLVASINISPSQLNDLRMIADLRCIMWRYRIVPNQIEFEITEEELITNFRKTRSSLEMLKNFGFRTALDDFGSGYSSLGQLKKFQFDTLKLDRIFISTDDYHTESSVGVIASIKALADRLNMNIVAEGIETESQLDFIRSFGIQTVQGFFYSKPLPFDVFTEQYLAKESRQVE